MIRLIDCPLNVLVARSLESYGWDTKDILKYGSAKKSYVTYVGVKEAIAYLYFDAETGRVELQAEYHSEGRNVLGMVSKTLSTTDTTEAAALARAFAEEIDTVVNDTYAMRLMRGAL